MAITTDEANKINSLYTQLDDITAKYHAALEDIHKLTSKITEYADALVEQCGCTDKDSKKSK